MILPLAPHGPCAAPTPLAADAHAAGLKVAAWTFRAEPKFLPADHRDDFAGWLRRFQTLGVDAVFCDFPGQAVAAFDGA